MKKCAAQNAKVKNGCDSKIFNDDSGEFVYGEGGGVEGGWIGFVFERLCFSWLW